MTNETLISLITETRQVVTVKVNGKALWRRVDLWVVGRGWVTEKRIALK